jgi:glucose/arabinose dehydrogenase
MLVALTTTAHTQTPLTLELVAAGLQQPVFAAAPTGDFSRVFVVEQPGRIRIVRDGNLLPTPFLDLTGQISAGGERGLLGLAFHPDFATNRRFYVFATVNPYLHATVRGYTASATNPDLADPTSATTLLTVPLIYGNHNGGMLAFGPDHMLYVAIGDGGSIPPAWPSDPFNHAQRGDSLLGKLLRLDVDNPAPPLQYGIPAGNPFVGPGNPLDEIWALGLRNPWRFSFDRLTGDLWLADVGGQREEVNFRPAGSPGGQNYGWSCMAGTFCVNTGACVCGDPALTMPLHEYTATMSRAIIGGYVYRGAAIPDLRGTYFYADFSLGVIRSFQNQGGTVAQLVDRTAELNPQFVRRGRPRRTAGLRPLGAGVPHRARGPGRRRHLAVRLRHGWLQRGARAHGPDFARSRQSELCTALRPCAGQRLWSDGARRRAGPRRLGPVRHRRAVARRAGPAAACDRHAIRRSTRPRPTCAAAAGLAGADRLDDARTSCLAVAESVPVGIGRLVVEPRSDDRRAAVAARPPRLHRKSSAASA